jgi:glycosyltransferase involved in cell wall biosynthesis
MRPISVLLTNNALGPRAGSETYVRDVALALLRRGHRPVAFSLVLGEVADELRRATIPVIDDATRLGEAPDVIHGHHHVETLIAALTFPGAPVVNFCHGWLPWEELPLHHPAVRRYVAVDEVCADRLVREEGIPRSRVELLPNFVDMNRFRPRPPLPPRPVRGLVLSNAATADAGYARTIVAACHAAGIQVDVIGAASGNSSSTPELLLPAYDVVFAKARTALEALAVGCAVVLTDAAGAGPLVTPQNCEVLRARNFGIRALTHAHDTAWYGRQIAEYSASAAADVSARVRAAAGIEPAIDRLIEIYAAAIEAPPGPGDASRAAAGHCCRIAQPLKDAYAVAARCHSLTAELELARAEIDAHSRAAHEYERQLASARDETRALQGEIDAFRALPTLRLRDAVIKSPVGAVLQASARRLARLLP